MATRLPPGMAPDQEEVKAPKTAAQKKKNAARAAARKAKRVAEKTDQTVAADTSVDDTAEALGEMKVVEKDKGNSGRAGGPPGAEEASGPAEKAKKVTLVFGYVVPTVASGLFDDHLPVNTCTSPPHVLPRDSSSSKTANISNGKTFSSQDLTCRHW